MALDTQAALDAVAASLRTGKELQDERKRLTRFTAGELRDLINLQCELEDPSSAPQGTILRPKRIRL